MGKQTYNYLNKIILDCRQDVNMICCFLRQNFEKNFLNITLASQANLQRHFVPTPHPSSFRSLTFPPPRGGRQIRLPCVKEAGCKHSEQTEGLLHNGSVGASRSNLCISYRFTIPPSCLSATHRPLHKEGICTTSVGL